MGFGAFLATTLGKVIVGAVSTVVVLGGTGGILYLNDFGIQATIVGKECQVGGSTITLQTKLGGFETMQPMDFEQCALVQNGNFVIYNIKSERVRLFDVEGGCLIYDSAGPEADCGGPTSQPPTGGGILG